MLAAAFGSDYDVGIASTMERLRTSSTEILIILLVVMINVCHS